MAQYSLASYGATRATENLDWVFLVDWILLLFASITIIFYFNRYIGALISFGLKLYVWNTYKVRVKVKSLKVSFLGGRIFFKNLTVITKNETISVLQGTFTWRYWLNATLATDLKLDLLNRDKTKNEKLPTRFILQIYGFEHFMYNRAYAYDNIMDFLKKCDQDSSLSDEDKEMLDKETSTSNRNSSNSSETYGEDGNVESQDSNDGQLDNGFHFFSVLNSLPMTIEVKKGALVFGNKNTSSILVISFAQGDGLIDIGKSDNKLDPYKTVFKMNFIKPKILLKPNLSYEEPKSKAYKKFKSLRKRDIKSMNHGRIQKLIRISNRIVTLLKFQSSKEYTSKEDELAWNGLKQYVEYDGVTLPEATNRITANHDEYAKYSEILDAEEVLFCYYYDVAGKVPTSPEPTLCGPDIHNGGNAPVYGLYLSVSRGVLHYGPWANRERVGIQKMLFPSACRDAEPHGLLKLGDTRKYTSFKLEVNVADELTMRVPFREFSKNTKVENDAGHHHHHKDATDTEDRKPPFGWLEVKLQKDSCVITETSYTPTLENGWDNKLRVELVQPEVRSSTNHDIFFKTARHILQADIGFPLEWNGLTKWNFHNRVENTDIFLLREHVTLLSDMVSDFSYGAPTPYELFKPFIYNIEIDFVNGYNLYLNINDNNVINNPLDFNDNVYLSFQGESLYTKVNIPLTSIVKKSTCVSYDLSTEWFKLVLDAPPWHTLNNFLKSKTIGKAQNFSLAGSYTYHSVVELSATDTIVIDCNCEDTVLEFYGFILRYLLIIKENYFGIHRIFKTLLEYTDELSDDKQDSSQPPLKKRENEMDLLFTFALQNGCCILPSNIYNCDSNVALYFQSLDIDVRYTNYYMDMQCNLSKIMAKHSTNILSSTLIEDALKPEFKDLKDQMIINKFCAHGHRMFGLPPLEPTYFCKWDFTMGSLVIDSNPNFLHELIRSLKSLKFTMKDYENLLVTKPVILNDMVVITFDCPKVSIRLLNEDGGSMDIVLSPISMNFNDIANERYSKRMNLKIPLIQLKMMGANSDVQSLLQTSIYFTNFVRKKDFINEFNLQQEHVSVNDGPFHRVPFLIKRNRNVQYRNSYGNIKPSFSLPNVAPPLNAQSVDFIFEDLPFSQDDDDEDWNTELDDSKASPPKPINITTLNTGSTARSYYTDSDYSPTGTLDPNYEHDNLIVNLGAVEGFINPNSLTTVVSILDKFNNYTIEAVMDSLHIETVSGLRLLANDMSTIVNIRLLLPLIDIKYGVFEGISSIHEFKEKSDLPDHLELTVNNVSALLAFRTTKTLTGAIRLLDKVSVLKESTSAVHVREVALNIVKCDESYDEHVRQTKVILSSLHDLEFWNTSNETEGFIGSVNTRTYEWAVDGDELPWFSEYLNTNIAHILMLKSKLKEIFSRKKLALTALLYKVSTAGAHYHIEHDPAVLTKPAYIMRSSPNHTRSHDSWKVVVRLRHLLHSLPPQWLQRTSLEFQDHQWSVEDGSSTVVLNIFRNWRSWEFSDIANCFLFRKVFEIEDSQAPKSPDISLKRFHIAFETLAARLNSLDLENDYICLDFLNCSLSFEDSSKLNFGFGNNSSMGTHINVVFSLESIRDRFSPLSLKLADFFKNLKLEPEEKVSEKEIKKSITPKYSFDMSSVINKTEHRIVIDKTGFYSTGKGLTLNALAVANGGIHGDMPFNIAMGSESLACEVFLLGNTVAMLGSKDGTIIVSNSGTLKTGLKNIDFSLSKFKLKCDQGTDEYILFLDTLATHDLNLVKDLLSRNKPKPAKEPEPKKPMSLFAKCPIFFTTSIDKVTWDIELISPVKYIGHLSGISINTHIINDVLISNLAVHSVITNILSSKDGIERLMYLKTELSKFQLFSKMLLADDHDLLNIFTSSDRAVLTIPQFVESLKSVQQDKQSATNNIKRFKNVLRKFKDISVNPEKPRENAQQLGKQKSLLTKIFVKNNYAAVVTSFEKTIYRLDTRSASLSQFNYGLNEDNEIKRVKPYGEMNFPNSRFIIGSGKDECIVIGLNLDVKIINPEKIEHELQSLQVELNHFRLFLTPDILTRLLVMKKVVSSIVESCISNSRSSSLVETSLLTKTSKSKQGSVFGFYSIHILAYNICLGWVFDNSASKSKGIIMGCERIFVVSEEKVGKLTLVDAYLSLALGSTPLTFFSKNGEFSAPTRAYLPHMQFIYAIRYLDGHKDVHATVSGEQLDVRFEADGVNVIEEVLKSINHCKALLNDKNVFEQKKNEKLSTFENVSMDRVGFHSIECITRFAGAKVVVYNTDAECFEDCSSFTLESPAIKVALEYVHNPKLAAIKKHNIKIEVITSASKNILYATCVPVINNLYHGVRKMMRSAAPQSKSSPTETKDPGPPSQNTILDDIGINFGIRVEPQEIALSCEPTARVQAIASCDGLDLRVGSCDDSDVIWTLLKIEGLRASLQHVYSRETSGSFDIEEILLTAFYHYKGDKKLSTSTYVSDVQALVNVKQLQDLDLFRDIWIPKEFYHSEEDISTSSRITKRANLASESIAMPWIIDLLILKVNCTVDMGKSLGVLNLNMNRLWAVSRKEITWEQNLRLAVEKIALTSEGRLGGELIIDDVTLLTAISWVVNEKVYEHPLVVISTGIGSIQSKSSLDFHTFFVCNIKELSLNIFNKRGKSSTSHDSLFATADVASLEVYFTALAASNFWDIYNTALRIHKDIRVSYKEVLKDSSNKTSKVMLRKMNKSDESFNELMDALTTNLNVKLGQILVHIYPSSLMDSQVVVFKLSEANAKFFQNTSEKLENRLKLKMTDFIVSLSTFQNKVNDENAFNAMSIEDFFKNTREVKGGTIFVFPSMVIDMDIWQELRSNVIEYKFRSSFGGKVDIRWNLGSVNFIRDMWTSHANALSSRLESHRRIQTKGAIEMQAVSGDKSLFETANLEDKLKDVESGSKYKYVALAPLVAEAPQLKELGDATPPLEWFGLHRTKFPNMTHQMIILSLQKMVHEVETQYGRILK